MKSEEAFATLSKKESLKLKIIKDLGFLLEARSEVLSAFTVKYILEEGEGEVISDIAHPFVVKVAVMAYDYEGRMVEKWSSLVI